MYVHPDTDQTVEPGKGFAFDGVFYPPNTWSASDILALGFVELTRIDAPPSDIENYNREEYRSGTVATAVYKRKSDEQINRERVTKLDQQITAVEASKPFTHRSERDFKGGVAVGLLLTCDSLSLILDTLITPPAAGQDETDPRRIAVKDALVKIRAAANKTYGIVAAVESPIDAIRQQRKAITG